MKWNIHDRVELIKDYIGENDMMYVDAGYKGTVTGIDSNIIEVTIDMDPGDTECDVLSFSHGMEVEYLRRIKK